MNKSIMEQGNLVTASVIAVVFAISDLSKLRFIQRRISNEKSVNAIMVMSLP